MKLVAPLVDAMIVVGAPNSSNSQRLQGSRRARRLPPCGAGAARRTISTGSGSGRHPSLGITAGASAPEVLVEEMIDAFAERYELRVETMSAAEETMFFPLPRPLRLPQAAE